MQRLKGEDKKSRVRRTMSIKLVKNRKLSWAIRLILIAIPVYLVLVFPYVARHRHIRQSREGRANVERIFKSLAAKGVLQMPEEGIGVVSFLSINRGSLFAIWFHRGACTKKKFRYFAYRKRSTSGTNVWFFKDADTGQVIDSSKYLKGS